MFVVLVICIGEVPAILAMKLYLLIHLSLRKGGTFPPQSGEYLQDSFCLQSLVPAFSAVEEELKQLITTDQWHMVGMLVISGAGVLGNLFLAWKLKQLGKKMGRNKEQV